MNQTNPQNMQSLPFWRRIAFRVLTYAFLGSTIPLIIVVASSLYISRQALEAEAYSTLAGIAEQQAQRITDWIESVSVTLEIISENTATFTRIFQNDESQLIAIQVANNYMHEVADDDPHIEDFFIYDLEGWVVAASSPQFLGHNVNNQPYFQDAFAAEDFYIEPPFLNEEGQMTLLATDIIENADGSAMGIMVVVLDIDNLNVIMNDRTGLGETGETYLVSRETSQLLTPSRFEDYPQNRSYSSLGIDAALRGEAGFGIYPDYRGVSVIGNYRYLPELQLALVAEVDETEGMAAVTQLTNLMFIVTLVILILSAFAAAMAALQQARPIVALTEVATAIAKGDLSKRVKIQSSDELGILAEDFNLMADNLAKSIDDLTFKFQEVDEANKQLKIANAKAKEATRLKSEFLANMSHELRTPLNAIIGFTGIMLEGFAGEIDDDAKHMVKRVYDNSKGLLNLINDILDIAKIEAGRLEISKAPFSPEGLADQWRTRIAVLAEQKGLSFAVEVDNGLPSRLNGDAERLSQVAMNLLSNAIKFTHEGGVSLQLLAKGHLWQLIVSDTGIGIPPHAQEYIFDEFRQVDGSSMRSYGGTGLGLAITRKLVLTMGGTVSVESILNQGSKFVVSFPIEEATVGKTVMQPESA